MSVFVGDHGTNFEAIISDENGIVDLSTSRSIVALFSCNGKFAFRKDLSVIDASAGLCGAILTRSELKTAGSYVAQITVYFQGDREFTGSDYEFKVLEKKLK